jgi:hypothetical protein
MLDLRESRNEKLAHRLRERGGKSTFKPLFGPEQQTLRWHTFRERNPEELLELMSRTAGPKGKPADMASLSTCVASARKPRSGSTSKTRN